MRGQKRHHPDPAPGQSAGLQLQIHRGNKGRQRFLQFLPENHMLIKSAGAFRVPDHAQDRSQDFPVFFEIHRLDLFSLDTLHHLEKEHFVRIHALGIITAFIFQNFILDPGIGSAVSALIGSH